MHLAGTKVLVTGGAGFIGSELVHQLVAADVHVSVVDNLTNGKRAHLAGLPAAAVQLHVADIRDPDTLERLLAGVKIVFHLACLGVRHSIHSPLENHEVNAHGTLELLLAARACGVQRFVHVSSSEVYGSALQTPMTENHPTFPMTVYGAAKLAGEGYARAFHRTYGFPAVIVRPFNTYGPRCHHEGDSGEVIPKFLLRCLAGRPLIVFGDGRQTRDFTYVSDTARGIIAASVCEAAIGQTINLGSGRETSINELAAETMRVAGAPGAALEHDAPRPGDVARLCADTHKARELLRFEPEIDLRSGLAHLLAWYQGLGQSWQNLLRQETVHNWAPQTTDPGTRPQRLLNTVRNSAKTMKVSVVIPAYNEEATLMLLRERLSAVITTQREYEFEVVLVDDHSSDASSRLIQDWVNASQHVRGVRLARNGGSHAAATAGLAHCTGDCAVVMAADLQDPPELLSELLAVWRTGHDVVWAVRSGRRGISWRTQLCSRLYWAMMRTVALPETPAQGADVVLLDRKVIAALLAIREKNTSLLSLIAWLGFRQTHIAYVKEARAAGTSHWTLARRIKLAIDSLLSFSALPIRLTWICGLLFLAGATAFAATVAVGWLIGGWRAQPAATAIIGLLLVGFGVLLTFLGAAGEYIWRAYDEIRGRPRYIVEQSFEPQGSRFVSDTALTTPHSVENAAVAANPELCPLEQEA